MVPLITWNNSQLLTHLCFFFVSVWIIVYEVHDCLIGYETPNIYNPAAVVTMSPSTGDNNIWAMSILTTTGADYMLLVLLSIHSTSILRSSGAFVHRSLKASNAVSVREWICTHTTLTPLQKLPRRSKNHQTKRTIFSKFVLSVRGYVSSAASSYPFANTHGTSSC